MKKVDQFEPSTWPLNKKGSKKKVAEPKETIVGNPIQEYTSASVGGRWSTIYTDLTRLYPRDEPRYAKYYEDFFRSIKLNTVIIKDKICYGKTIDGVEHYLPVSQSSARFYVDPGDGILYEKKSVAKNPKRKPIQVRKEDHIVNTGKNQFGNHYQIKIGSKWYGITVTKLQPPQPEKYQVGSSLYVSYPKHTVVSQSIEGALFKPEELDDPSYYVKVKQELWTE